MSKNHSSI